MGFKGKFIKKLASAVFVAGFANLALAEKISAEKLFDVGGFPVTNAMLTTWIFAFVIIMFFRFVLLRGGARLVPSKGQMVVESMVDGLRGLIEPLMGAKAFRGAFPLLLGFFAYILIMNWSGLLPGVGSVGVEEGGKFVPVLRPANTDLNSTLALAIISFGAWFFFVIKYAGAKALIKDIFGNKASREDVALPIYLALFVVFFLVGCIDLISIVMRLLSLSFRLFGNNFGGEALLENMHALALGLPRFVSWLIPLPFYLLEMLIGFIQAFVFTLLSAIYIGLITNHDG